MASSPTFEGQAVQVAVIRLPSGGAREPAPPDDMPTAALHLLERLIASEDTCDRLRGRLQQAKERIAQLEFEAAHPEHSARS